MNYCLAINPNVFVLTVQFVAAVVAKIIKSRVQSWPHCINIFLLNFSHVTGARFQCFDYRFKTFSNSWEVTVHPVLTNVIDCLSKTGDVSSCLELFLSGIGGGYLFSYRKIIRMLPSEIRTRTAVWRRQHPEKESWTARMIHFDRWGSHRFSARMGKGQHVFDFPINGKQQHHVMVYACVMLYW